MRVVLAAAAASLFMASPAYATGGLRCTAEGGRGPVLTMVLGHGVVPQLVSVTLVDARQVLSTHGHIAAVNRQPMIVGQSWIDAREIRLDLLDAQAMRFEGQLRARFQPRVRGRPALGTFVRAGRTWPMRCEEA